jgi:carbamoyl-phosphate synthase large subunit
VIIPEKHQETIREYTKMIANEMNVVGLMNIQYAIYEDVVYILEANPRASRTVPLVSKICNISMAKVATQILLGEKLSGFNFKERKIEHFGVKEAVFPFNMFPDVDPLLGPEMRSTGEVLGLADSYGLAFFKSQEATMTSLPLEGTVLITIADRDKDKILECARNFADMRFNIMATGGTKRFLEENGIECELVKMVPYITTTSAALAATKGIKDRRNGAYKVKSLQEYHRNIPE